MSKKASKNLVGLERSIQVFDKSHDIVQETEINISLEELLKIIGLKEEDPFLYGFYKLTNEQTNALLRYANDSLKIDLNTCYCVAACFGIYD